MTTPDLDPDPQASPDALRDPSASAGRRRRPSWRTAAAVLITVGGLGGLTAAQVVYVAPGVERDLRTRTEQALRAGGFAEIGVRVDGRDVALTGTADDARAASAAEHVALSVSGVRYVDSVGLRVRAAGATPSPTGAATPSSTAGATAPAATGPAPRIVVVADQGRALVAGALPGTAAAARLTKQLITVFGAGNVEAGAVTVSGAGTTGVDALAATVAALGPDADAVAVTLDAGRITVAAGVTDPAVRTAALAAAAKAVTDPADVVDRLSIGSGVATPAQVQAQLDSLPVITYAEQAVQPDPTGRSVLSAVAFVLAQRSRARVTLVGHSDDTGDAAADTRRSLERAQLAETYLAGLGVARSRVTVRGVGTQDPAVDGDSPEADVANRRLEVRGGS